ncbi:hypothetical protein NKI20_22140 [Mesorhizobium sp. M0830]|uniref:hypothetical protein n=1 Tax=Mesorhizobium sp. M0830 TaxID=2957008 RepID=UPI0033359BF6
MNKDGLSPSAEQIVLETSGLADPAAIAAYVGADFPSAQGRQASAVAISPIKSNIDGMSEFPVGVLLAFHFASG